jgi:uncharacterized membrane protein YjfL (UPF0719 family)
MGHPRCEAEGNCQENVTQAECSALGGVFLGSSISCAQGCVDEACIPTVSEWGLVVLALLILTAGTVTCGRAIQRPGTT